MANGSLRRSIAAVGRATKRNERSDESTDGGVDEQSTTVESVDRIADSSDKFVVVESFSSSDDDTPTIDPTDIDDGISARNGDGNDSGDSTRKRRKRRDAGVERTVRRGKKEAPQNIEALVSMAHTWASVFLKAPEMMVTKDEAKQLSDAYGEFCKYHEVPILTPKRVSEVNLVVALLAVEGTRLVAVFKRKKSEQQLTKLTEIPQRQNVQQNGMINPIN